MTEKPKFIKIGDDVQVPLVDVDKVPASYVDFITELAYIEGVLHVSFGSFISDGDGPASGEVRVVSRLRINGLRAARFLEVIQNTMKNAGQNESPIDPSKVN